MTRCPGTISLRCQEMAPVLSGWFLAVSPASLGQLHPDGQPEAAALTSTTCWVKDRVADCCSPDDVLGLSEGARTLPGLLGILLCHSVLPAESPLEEQAARLFCLHEYSQFLQCVHTDLNKYLWNEKFENGSN